MQSYYYLQFLLVSSFPNYTLSAPALLLTIFYIFMTYNPNHMKCNFSSMLWHYKKWKSSRRRDYLWKSLEMDGTFLPGALKGSEGRNTSDTCSYYWDSLSPGEWPTSSSKPSSHSQRCRGLRHTHTDSDAPRRFSQDISGIVFFFFWAIIQVSICPFLPLQFWQLIMSNMYVVF